LPLSLKFCGQSIRLIRDAVALSDSGPWTAARGPRRGAWGEVETEGVRSPLVDVAAAGEADTEVVAACAGFAVASGTSGVDAPAADRGPELKAVADSELVLEVGVALSFAFGARAGPDVVILGIAWLG
jgi:hypothetical protein